MPEPSSFEVELAFEMLKSHESPGTDQILGEFIKAGGRTIRYEIHKLTVSIFNKEVPEEWKESNIVPIYKKVDKRDGSNYRGISLLPSIFKVLTTVLLSRLTPYAEEILGLIMYSAFVKYLKKKMGIQRSITSSLYRLKESLLFS